MLTRVNAWKINTLRVFNQELLNDLSSLDNFTLKGRI